MHVLIHRPDPFGSLGLAALAAVVGLHYLLVASTGGPYGWGRMPEAVEWHQASLSAEDTASAQRLDAAFARIGYRLDVVAQSGEVPPVFLAGVPSDMVALAEPATRKQVFLRLMLPLILVANEDIAEDRRRLEAVLARKAGGHALAAPELAWLDEIAARYEGDSQSPADLLHRVDVVPPSLALAQAAEESGWGTSRFVRTGNNLFGHTRDDGQGMAPSDGESGPRLAAFDTLGDAVRAYLRNLNTHRAYEDLRRARTNARARNVFPDGHTLAGSLIAYSIRGQDYVDTIRAIIRANGLVRFDHARLGRGSSRMASAN